MADYVFLCEKCAGVQVAPIGCAKEFNCPAGGMHRLQRIGEEGDENYVCSKCRATISITARQAGPGSHPCPGGGFHSWKSQR